MRLRSRKTIRSHAPFTGAGASLYIDAAFRRSRLWSGHFLCGTESTIGGTNVQKTARVDYVSDPTASFAVAAPLSVTRVYQVRTFKDAVENEGNYRPITVTYDGSGADATLILGYATLVAKEIRAGGIVRIKFRWIASRSGTQPTQFLAIRTAGPSSPANGSTSADGTGHYEVDTPALSDASAYTYKIQAKAGAVTADVLTGITFTADATGPTVPTSGTVSVI